MKNVFSVVGVSSMVSRTTPSFKTSILYGTMSAIRSGYKTLSVVCGTCVVECGVWGVSVGSGKG